MRNTGIALALTLLFVGCDHAHVHQNQYDATAFRFTDAIGGREIVLRAIKRTNAIASRPTRLALDPSWNAPLRADGMQRVTVYWLSPDNLGAREMIFVARECRCVMVQSAAFRNWLQTYTQANRAMLIPPDDAVLAFMLLHELGHIVDGDASAAFEKSAASSDEGLNLDRTAQKQKERKADAFAANLLIQAAKDRRGGRAIDAIDIELALSDLSWDVASIRLLDHFGATSLGLRQLFLDQGYTHPNFELRILTVNDQIQHTQASHRLLTAFMAVRSQPSEPHYHL